MSIRVLPPEVAAQIAAGEVVERPASVVKELVENAVDAGAHTIAIEVEGGGRRRIRVSDDGCGISTAEAELAFARHATSKLRSAADLDRIRTLGFRGEALASISAVSQVTMITRTVEEPTGVRLRLEGGRMTGRELTGSPAGTMVTVENLFYNVPARLKFLKAEATERGQIDAVTSRYAMAYPDRRFRLSHDGRPGFQSTGSGKLEDVLLEAFGLEVTRDLLEVSTASPDGSAGERSSAPTVRGFVSRPSMHRANRNQIILFVNGRWIQDTRLAFAVVQAYHTLLPTGRYPIAILLVELSPEDVDVNVHPTKAEVRFRQPEAIFSAVQRAVRRTLIDQAPIPEITRSSVWSPGWREPEPGEGRWETGDAASTPAPATPTPPDEIDWDSDLAATTQALPVETSGSLVGTQSPLSAALPSGATATGIPLLRVLGQVGAMYIVAEGPGGMFLIDQHAAHERVLYEKLIAQASGHEPVRQRLLQGVAVEVPPESAATVESSLPELMRIGFEIEPFGGNTFLVRALPALLVRLDPSRALHAALADLDDGHPVLAGTAEARLISRICKAAAIKGGQVLSQVEMEELVHALEACAAPRTCPHGRPTMIHLSADQLAREFGRV